MTTLKDIINDIVIEYHGKEDYKTDDLVEEICDEIKEYLDRVIG